MSDISPEQREPKSPPEVVKLNQEFKLFKADDIVNNPKKKDFDTIGEIALSIEGLPNLEFNLFLSNLEGSPEALLKERLYPPDPEKGYVITNEDFDPKKRLEKIKAIVNSTQDTNRILSSDYLEFGGLTLFGYDVHTGSGNPYLVDDKNKFKPEVLKVLNRLHLLLIFPNVTFQSKPEFAETGTMSFWEFYPIDSGQLAKAYSPEVSAPDLYLSGLNITFPNNREYIQSVKGMFELDPRTE